jgi:hypothetical protein
VTSTIRPVPDDFVNYGKKAGYMSNQQYQQGSAKGRYHDDRLGEIRAPAHLVSELREVAAANDRTMAAELWRAIAAHIDRERTSAA